MAAPKRGILVVGEGLDKAGKSGQIKSIKAALQGQVKVFKFPYYESKTGGIIRDHIQKKEEFDDHCVHLLFVANRREVATEIEECLRKGIHVIVDRYCFSGFAYSMAKNNMTLEFCTFGDVGLPAPDLVFFLDIDEKVASQRANYGDDIYEVEHFQAEVRKQFHRMIEPGVWEVLDGNDGEEDINKKILKAIEDTISRAEFTTIRKISFSPQYGLSSRE